LRDELRKEAKSWADRRDELNKKVRELIESAAGYREEREKNNEEVKQLKQQKDAMKDEIAKLAKELTKLKRRCLPRKGPKLSDLKKDLEKLEFKQMTTVLTQERERELVEAMSRVKKEIDVREKILAENSEIAELMAQLRKKREELGACTKELVAKAREAQDKHDTMIRLYGECDKLRKMADDAQKKFICTKKEGEDHHQAYLALLRKARDIEKVIGTLRRKAREERVEKETREVKQRAKEIYERFKSGEKISTEDLLLLQKAGLL
jgi:uncharacterized coiled-coil DUF342 family protein